MRFKEKETMSVQASSSAKSWHEASNVWMWRTQARILVLAQKAPSWLVFPPSTFFHFFLKRDWGMAVGPFFAFAIYGDARSYDLFLSASSGGVICGTFKHIIRSPRPFWIVPDVFLKNGKICHDQNLLSHLAVLSGLMLTVRNVFSCVPFLFIILTHNLLFVSL